VCLEDYSDIHVQPKFHYFGHFSKFIRPGDVRVRSVVVGQYDFADVEVNVKVYLSYIIILLFFWYMVLITSVIVWYGGSNISM